MTRGEKKVSAFFVYPGREVRGLGGNRPPPGNTLPTRRLQKKKKREPTEGDRTAGGKEAKEGQSLF